MKLNNKGFAITTIIYGTLILFLLLASSVLGILSTHKLRIQKLEDYAEDIIQNKEVTCTIVANISGETIDNDYGESVILSLNANKEDVTYSFDGDNYNKTSTKEIKKEGVITAYVKDSLGKKGNCSVNIEKRTEYKYRTRGYTAYTKSDIICLNSSAEALALEKTKTNLYYYDCGLDHYNCLDGLSGYDPIGTDSCYKYTREYTSWGNWSTWSITSQTKSYLKDVKTRDTYKAVLS